MIFVSDIATALGRPTPDANSPVYGQWQSWIDDAQLLISKGDGTRVGLGNLALLDQGTLDYVVREAVVAHVRNPDDATQVDVQVDDARVSKRFSSSTGRVRILPEWWGMLDPDLEAPGAFSIALPSTVWAASPCDPLWPVFDSP